MLYLGLVGISCVLCGGFLLFATMETRSDKRMLAGARGRLDEQVGRLFFIVEHVNWSEFLSHSIRGLFARILHDTAHLFLQIIRFIERQLTRTVRYLRDRRPHVLAPKPSRQSFMTTTRNYLSARLHRPKDSAE